MKSEGKLVKPEKEGEDSLDSIIRQAAGNDQFLSLSRARDNPVQLIQLLHALDQQGSKKLFSSPKAENHLEGIEQSFDYGHSRSSFFSDIKGSKESEHLPMDNDNHVKGSKSTYEKMQSRKIPETVVALAQAAARANGEPEKYLPGWPLLSPPKVQLQKCDKCSQEFCSAINHRRHTRVHRRSLNITKDSLTMREFLAAYWDKLSTEEAKDLVSFQNVAVEGVIGPSITSALSSWVRKPGFLLLPQAYVRAGLTLLDVIQARPSRFPITSQELFNALDDASENTFLCSGTALSVQKYVFDGEVGKNALEMKNLVACACFMLEQILIKSWLADKDAEALRCQKLLVEEEEAAQKRQADLLEKRRLKKLRQKEQRAKEQYDGEKGDTKDGLLDIPVSSGSTGISPRGLSESELSTSEASQNQDGLSFDPMGLRVLGLDANLRAPLHAEDADQSLGHQMQSVKELWKLPKKNRKPLNGFHIGQVPATKSSGLTRHGTYRDSRSLPLSNGHKIWTPKPKLECEAEIAEERDTLRREQTEEAGSSDKTKVMISSFSDELEDSGDHPQDATSRLENYQGKHVKSDSTHQISSSMGSSAVGGMDKNGGLESCSNTEFEHAGRDYSEPMLFSREVAEVFLAQRWKEAIAADHVKLVLSPETDESDSSETIEGKRTGSRRQSAGRSVRNILGNAENRMIVVGVEPTSTCKPKFRPKVGNSYKLKYVPKERSDAIGE